LKIINHPRIGRLITQDPLGMVDGPNLYVYCNNDPVNFIDPWGLCAKKTIGFSASVGSNTAKAIYQNLDAAKFNSFWENAAYNKYVMPPISQGEFKLELSALC
jgi:uncharacterized protein RhaS with RHS repeats